MLEDDDSVFATITMRWQRQHVTQIDPSSTNTDWTVLNREIEISWDGVTIFTDAARAFDTVGHDSNPVTNKQLNRFTQQIVARETNSSVYVDAEDRPITQTTGDPQGEIAAFGDTDHGGTAFSLSGLVPAPNDLAAAGRLSHRCVAQQSRHMANPNQSRKTVSRIDCRRHARDRNHAWRHGVESQLCASRLPTRATHQSGRDLRLTMCQTTTARL